MLKLQGLIRAKQGRDDASKKMARQINTSMEYAAEQKANKLDLFLSNLTSKMPELENRSAAKDALLDTIDKMRQGGWPMSIEVKEKEKYKGLTLPDPITKDSIVELMERLNENARKEAKKKKAPQGIKGVLHAKYALQIAVNYMDAVRKLPTVVRVSTAISGKLTVVGDMHGQLRDLIAIFLHNGLPSCDNPYLFNGDLVDRGEYSAEVCLLLMGFAVADPGCVYVNRGNHEDMTVCTGYGFVDELVCKFSQNVNGRHLLAVIDTIFSLLPLAHVIDDNVCVIHGGISDKFSVATLNAIQRRPYRTLTGLPATITQTPGGSDKEGHTHETWAVIMDCLWSDPAKLSEPFPKSKGCKPNDERGGGVMFSSDFSREWLEREKLGVLVRSHECQEMGFQSVHQGKVLTLFSASNYYGEDEENDGAVLVLSPHQTPQGKLLTYSTDYAGAKGYAKINMAASAAKLESAALQRVELALLDHRLELKQAFADADPEKTGQCAAIEWARIMNAIVPVKLPWLYLKAKFVTLVDGDPARVVYAPMMQKLEHHFADDPVDDAAAAQPSDTESPRAAATASGRENNHRKRDVLSKLFKILDSDGSGEISPEEFKHGCKIVNELSNETMLNATDIDALIKSLDSDKNGTINFTEFIDAITSRKL